MGLEIDGVASPSIAGPCSISYTIESDSNNSSSSSGNGSSLPFNILVMKNDEFHIFYRSSSAIDAVTKPDFSYIKSISTFNVTQITKPKTDEDLT